MQITRFKTEICCSGHSYAVFVEGSDVTVSGGRGSMVVPAEHWARLDSAVREAVEEARVRAAHDPRELLAKIEALTAQLEKSEAARKTAEAQVAQP
jgi:hypothetical protein